MKYRFKFSPALDIDGETHTSIEYDTHEDAVKAASAVLDYTHFLHNASLMQVSSWSFHIEYSENGDWPEG